MQVFLFVPVLFVNRREHRRGKVRDQCSRPVLLTREDYFRFLVKKSVSLSNGIRFTRS